jgi:hypothetical protein
MTDTTSHPVRTDSELNDFWKNQYAQHHGASPTQVVVGEAVAPQLGHHSAGENFHCGSPQVSCTTASVNVPSGVTVTTIVRDAREESGGPFTTDPYPVIGWCDWEGGISATAIQGNQIQYKTTLKNWSDNRARRARITIYYHA